MQGNHTFTPAYYYADLWGSTKLFHFCILLWSVMSIAKGVSLQSTMMVSNEDLQTCFLCTMVTRNEDYKMCFTDVTIVLNNEDCQECFARS
jgi:hypothetical protein